MKIINNQINLIVCAFVVLFLVACGASQQVEQTGITDEEESIGKNFVPGKTSTGACTLPTTPKEKKKALEVYSLYREDFKQEN